MQAGSFDATVGALEFFIGSEYGRLTVADSVLLGGTLNVMMHDEFELGLWQSFDLFDWSGGVSGEFSSIVLPTLADTSWRWDASAIYTTGEIAVVPEPASLSLLTLGALMILRRRMK